MLNTIPPLAVVLGIIFALALMGALVALVQNQRRFAGFKELAGDVREIAQRLGGEVFRDGGDLVVSGNYDRLPTVVRFSNNENVPGLNIRVGVPANFTLWVAPRQAEPGEGRATVRTGDTILDTRFLARSDDPGQARLFIAMQGVPAGLRKLACSTSTFITFSEGFFELSELEIPRPCTSNHLLEHLQSVSTLANTLKQMPGADTVRVEPLRKEPRLIGRAAIVAGVVATMAVVVAAMQPNPKPPELAAPTQDVAAGVLPGDAQRIAGITGWRAAIASDFDPNAASWLRSLGMAPTGRIAADFSGSGQNSDVAYALINQDGLWRIVLMVNGETRYDIHYPKIAVAARIPKSAVSSIQWIGSAPSPIDGDGLLIVRSADDATSALVVFSGGQRIVTAVPANYQTVDLR